MKVSHALWLCALAVSVGGAQADDKMTPDDAMMKAAMERIMPGPPHAALAKMAGTWDANVKAWMSPDQPPMESKGVCEESMIMGGRYLQQTFHGEMMGQPFEGMGYTGYDNVTQKYIGFWMDGMSTAWMTSTGTASADGKTFTFTGDMSDAMTNRVLPNKQVVSFPDDNHMHFELWAPGPDGKDMKWIEIAYTRKK